MANSLPDPEPAHIPVSKAAAEYGVSVNTFKRMAARGEVKIVKLSPRRVGVPRARPHTPDQQPYLNVKAQPPQAVEARGGGETTGQGNDHFV